MNTKADLHTHTLYSDGALDTKTLVDKINAAGISMFSVTDHDTIDALPEAIEYSKTLGMECITGIEMSTKMGAIDVHLLGYFFDHNAPAIKEYATVSKAGRIKRAEKIVAKLNGLGLTITMDDVTQRAKGSVIGRPHIAAAMIANKCVTNFAEAFQKYIGNDGPAYEPLNYLSFSEAVELLHSIGGIAVIAHPAILSEDVLYKAVNDGADGIETIHPSANTTQTETFKNIASEYFLLETGGSDFHGGTRNDLPNLGKYWIPVERVEKIRSSLKLQMND
ncbi:MAG TPA: PHP domain-containing protein [Candidatus Kapabacteria bacterium]|nr:PHP domain-containing protein [Candidatus Kapabacteria bacterium]